MEVLTVASSQTFKVCLLGVRLPEFVIRKTDSCKEAFKNKAILKLKNWTQIFFFGFTYLNLT